MRIDGVSNSRSFGTRNDLKGVIYVKPIKTDSAQQGIIQDALSALEEADYDKTDILYMKSMGINPPFKSGKEAVDYLKKQQIPIMYGKFSDKTVHACLARIDDDKKGILINAKYKNSKSEPEILATAEAINHELGHAKDNDNSNSIQEELDNLSLNVLAHRSFERKNPKAFDGCNSFIFKEGVSLYPKLFFEYGADKTGLKERVADKYGYMQAGDTRHPASELANEIKELNLSA